MHAVTESRPTQPWRAALPFAIPVTLLVLGLVLKWFAFDNRYVTFLYHHDMGPRVPDTRPFSPVTRSRIWMTGLVASGAVLVLTTGANFVLGRLSRRYRAPAWWRVWALCALPLAIGIPAITMTVNSPTIPLWLALLATVVALGGLAAALVPGRAVAERPLEATLLACDGVCLAMWLLVLPGLAYVPVWIASGRRVWLVMLVALPLIGLAGLGVLTLVRRVLRMPGSSTLELVVAGVVVAYSLLPFVHYVLGTDGLFYITDMENFFARDAGIQMLTWGITVGVIWAVAWLRRLSGLKASRRAL